MGQNLSGLIENLRFGVSKGPAKFNLTASGN
jgi:hypothetical protein